MELEGKLENERANIALLEQNLEKYNDLTNQASKILTVFGNRLKKVEENVFPLWKVTKSLETKQKNLDATIKKLDSVLENYSCSSELYNSIHMGVDSENVDVFLDALNRLKRAKEYFLSTNQGSVELENVTHLFNSGCDALNAYFKQQIRRHSSPFKPVDLTDLIYIEDDISTSTNDDYSGSSSIRLLPQDARKELKIIVEWLDENLRREYMIIYSDERSDIIFRSLIMLKEHQKSSSLGNEGGSKVKSFNRLNLGDSGKKKLQNMLERKANKLMSKGGMLRKQLNLSSDNFLNDDFYGENNDKELEQYLLLLLGLQKLLVVERQMLNDIIPSTRQNEVFSKVGQASIELIVKEADLVKGRVMKSISKREWSAALGVFSAIQVSLLQPDIEKVCNQDQKNQLSGVMNRFNEVGKSALDQFIDSIKNEGTGQVPLTSSSNFPRDATVHQLTSDTLWFLEHAFPYYEIIGPILYQDSVYSQPLQQISTLKSLQLEDQRNRALVGIYFRKVLTELNFTIITKADQIYNNEATRSLFKLNNIYYILKSLQRNNLMDVVKFTEVDCEKRYLKMIDDLKNAYQATWQKLLSHVVPIADCPKPVNGKLKDKDRAIVKEKFSNFNKEIDECVKNQRGISVPDLLLREGLKRDNLEAVIPHYHAFYELYADCDFAKNREKYVRYTPHHLSTLLNNLFDDRV